MENLSNPSRRMFNASAGGRRRGHGPDRVRSRSGSTKCPRRSCRPRSRKWSARYKEQLGKDINVSDQGPMPGVQFAYALDISRCIGCRRCVYACVEENNQSRDPQIQWIRVFSMEKEKGVDFTHADPYYNPPEVPEEGHFYVPVSCQQCENPPCTKVCPTGATWAEKDGIVVIDYDWCIGCRYCMAACPYGARHFNWTDADDSEGRDQHQHALPGQPAAAQGRGREVHLLHPAHARRPISGLRRGLPGGGAQVRQHPRSRQRDPLHHREQARAGPQRGIEHRPEVLLLLCNLRVQSTASACSAGSRAAA